MVPHYVATNGVPARFAADELHSPGGQVSTAAEAKGSQRIPQR